jgi:hypothetical protein
MEAWLKYIGDSQDNYCRWGVRIPHTESKYDINKLFKCDEKKAEFYLSKLMADPRVKCKPHKSAGNTQRAVAEKLEAKEVEKKVEEIKKVIDKEVTNEVKPTVAKKPTVRKNKTVKKVSK